MSNTPYEVKLSGYVLALAKIGIEKCNYERIISFYGKCYGTYYPDWQEDGYYMHDEGYCDYDIERVEPCDNEDFCIIDCDGNKRENEKYKILEIISILDEDLEME